MRDSSTRGRPDPHLSRGEIPPTWREEYGGSGTGEKTYYLHISNTTRVNGTNPPGVKDDTGRSRTRKLSNVNSEICLTENFVVFVSFIFVFRPGGLRITGSSCSS